MVTLKKRFRGVRQNLKMARATWSKRMYNKFWKIVKKSKKNKFN